MSVWQRRIAPVTALIFCWVTSWQVGSETKLTNEERLSALKSTHVLRHYVPLSELPSLACCLALSSELRHKQRSSPHFALFRQYLLYLVID